MSSARDFAGDYSPGGLTGRSRARALGRAGGKASGRKRRALARGRRLAHRRTRNEALGLAYRHHQLTRSKFDLLYEQAFPPPEHPPALKQWSEGRTTLWLEYRLTWRLYRRRGQHCGTTNGRREVALERAHRGRCRRTVQRLHRKLELMGLIAYSHAKRSGEKQGERDYLVIEIRTPACHPPASGGSLNCPPGRVQAPPTKENHPNPGTEGVAPPPAADAEPPDKPADRPVTEREGLLWAIDCQEAKLAAGWQGPSIKLRLHELRRQLRELDQLPLACGQSSSRSARTTSAGLRWSQ